MRRYVWRAVVFAGIYCVAIPLGFWLGRVGGQIEAAGFTIFCMFSLVLGIVSVVWARRLSALYSRWEVNGQPHRTSAAVVQVSGVFLIIQGLIFLFAPMVWNLSHDRPWYFHYTPAANTPAD